MFLNNGITMICTNYVLPSKNKPAFKVMQPGVINGLQTVVSLYEAYEGLSQEEQKDLEEHCYVLTRLLKERAVKDVNAVVLASNTQNPMQARNLKSNTTEQIYYEKLFANEGWFYERKQGAWEAFFKDPDRWRTLRGFAKSSFRISGSGTRPKYRCLDNELISQTWLSFIGFSDRAVHEKRYIFDRDDLYSLAFLHRTRSHGAEYNFDFAAAREDWIAQAPSPKLMLVSFLSRALAQRIALSARENREKTCKRLAIDPEHTPKEEIDHMCGQDEEFLVEQILSGMTFVFTDVFGYILYKAIGERVHDVGHLVLQNGSLDQAHRTANYDEIAERIRKNDFGDNDLLPIGYSAFRHVIEQMTGSAWRISYQTARTRSRFNHSAETRRRIYRELDQLDQFMKRTQLTRPWAVSIPAGVGLYGYFKKALS